MLRNNTDETLMNRFDGMSSVEVFEKARDRAFRLLAYRARSSKEITDKLTEDKYPDVIIAKVMELLLRYDYINDYEFARNYIESRINSKGYGELRLRHELRQKGIEKDTVNDIFASMEIDAVDIAVSLLEKRQRGDTEADYAEKNRCYGFLMRKGYSSNVITQAFKQYFT